MTRQELETIISHANEIIRNCISGETKQENDLYKRGFFNIDDFKNIVNLEEEESFSQRVKPSPTYRPFANAEECWNEMLKHQPFGWVYEKECTPPNEGVYMALDVVGDNVRISECKECEEYESFEEMFQNFAFADRTPFGIKESEG